MLSLHATTVNHGNLYYNLFHDTIEGKMLGKATHGRKRMELLHDIMEGRDYE